MTLKYPIGTHPGREYVKVICDVCGGLFHQKDTVRVTNKFNYQNGLVVCFKDLDEINEQILPNNHIDSIISSPGILRPERPDQFVVNETDNRLPSAPRQPYTRVNPIDNLIDLYWMGPNDAGSSSIIGYKILRAEPQLAFYDTVDDNTSDPATYYTDTTANVSSEYSYKVAAVNSFGTGPYSEEFFWPTNRVPYGDIEYLVTDLNQTITTDSGIAIRLNLTNLGVI